MTHMTHLEVELVAFLGPHLVPGRRHRLGVAAEALGGHPALLCTSVHLYICTAGHPVLRLQLRVRSELGAPGDPVLRRNNEIISEER